MAGIYSKLYKYRQTELKDNLENYLTEALCDLLNRMSWEGKKRILALCLSSQPMIIDGESWIAECFTEECKWATQYQITVEGKHKYPDIVCINGEGKPLIVIENKISAGFTHRFNSHDNEWVHQLKDYDSWLYNSNKDGILLLLKHCTEPPENFYSPQSSYQTTRRGTITWNSFSIWIRNNTELNNEVAFLVEEFCRFLEELDMTYEQPTFSDVVTVGSVMFGPGRRFSGMMQSVRGYLEKLGKPNIKWRLEKSYLGRDLFAWDNDEKMLWSWAMLKSSHYSYFGWGVSFPGTKLLASRPKIPYCFFGIYTKDRKASDSLCKLNSLSDKEWAWRDDGEDNHLVAISTCTIDKIFPCDKDGGELYQEWVADKFNKAYAMVEKANWFLGDNF